MNFTTDIYWFNLIDLQLPSFSSIQGIKEKILCQAYETQLKFIFELMQNADKDRKPVSHLCELWS